MKKQLFSLLIIIICLLILYYHFKSNTSLHNTLYDTLRADPVAAKDTGLIVLPNNSPPIKDTLPGQIATGNIQPEAIVNFAESLIGTPYKLSLIHISEPTRLGMISYAVFCLKKKKT